VEAINSERIAVGEAVNHDPGRCRKFPAENQGSQAIDTLGLLSGRIVMSLSFLLSFSFLHLAAFLLARRRRHKNDVEFNFL
jgi:hypothetical protein